MADTVEVPTSTHSELLAAGRRNLAVREFTSAVETLAAACELLAKEHGDTADQCAEAYLWYGKALLGLSREESGVLGDGVPGTGNADAEEEDDNEEQEGENGEAAEEEKAGEAEAVKENGEAISGVKKSDAESTSKKEVLAAEKSEAESTTNEDAGMSADDTEEPGTTSNGDAEGEEGEGDADVSMMNVDGDGDEEVDNLQLAWEMLDLSRSILFRRVQEGGGEAARALLADVHLALGEVALESETYDKAVIDMQSCLDLQKDLYGTDDRRIAETHYQIGLANSLASNFEDAITHFKNAANILGTRIKTLENPGAADDATVKKYATADPGYSIDGEIKELKELLPEIQEKIQDMMDYKAETIKRVRESLFSSNGAGSASGSGFSASAGSFSNGSGSFSNGAGSSTAKPAADISHLIKRKRKASDSEAPTSAKRASTAGIKSEAEPAKSAMDVSKSEAEPAKSATKVSKSEAEPAKSAVEVTKSAAEPAKSATRVSKSDAEPAKSAAEVSKSEADSSAKTVET